MPLVIPVKPTFVKMLDKGTPDNDKFVGGLALPKPLAALAENRGKNPSVLLPISREPLGLPGSVPPEPVAAVCPTLNPAAVVWVIIPAAFIVNVPDQTSTVPDTLTLKVSDGRKF